MTRIIGIDVGLTGAVAVLPDGLLFDTPTAVVARGKQKRSVYVPAQMLKILMPLADWQSATKEELVAIIEDVHATPKAMGGVSSSFSLGLGKGYWVMALTALSIPYDLVTPQRWKRAMMDGMGKDKDASRVRALQLFPDLADQLGLKKHHGRADALLIAEYRRRLEVL